MRAMRLGGLLLAALLFTHGTAASAAAAGLAGGPRPAVLPAASVTAHATPAPVPSAPGQRPAELDYLPRDDGRGGARGIGWLLIAAAIVLAIIIVGFVVRHHRTGRPG